MALVLKDRVKESSNTTGTGTFSLGGAYSGFQSFSVIGNSNTTYYAIVNLSAAEWEVGIGTYTASGATLSRDTILESSNSGSAVNFSAGTKDVFCTYPAEKAVTLDDVQTLSNKTIASPSVSGNLTFTGTGNRITGDFSNATVANRVMFQTSTVNGNTNISILPNGTSTSSGIQAFNNSTDPQNSSRLNLAITNAEVTLRNDILGTGSYLPMTFYTGGSERMRIDSIGNVGIGTTNPTYRLDVYDENNRMFGLYQSNNSDGPVIRCFRTKGTLASPTGVIAGDVLSSIRGFGYTSAGAYSNPTNISTFAAETFTSTASGSYITFTTTSIGSTTPTERVRIDPTGNVGIGTSSPAGSKSISIDGGNTASGDGSQLLIKNAGTVYGGIGNYSSVFGGAYDSTIAIHGYNGLRFFTVGAEKMRIDSSGNLLVGYTSKGATTVTGHVAANAYNCKAGAGAALSGNVFNINWTGSAQLWIDTTNVGTISVTSDYRVKKNVETQVKTALDRVLQLRPVTYEFQDYGVLFKADGVAREGFIAHELQAVIPSAVEGEKDAENQIQSLKLDALCSVLTKAIQEQQAIITQLQADVALLKGN